MITSAIGRQAGEIEFHVVDRLHGFSTTVEKNRQVPKTSARTTAR